MVDKLPFYVTKAESNLSASVEGAYLIPGHSKAIGNAGTSYIDDFEGSVSVIDLRTRPLVPCRDPTRLVAFPGR